MLGRRFYKTKPCILFQRGRCPRQNCTFAHGEAELRRVGGPPFMGSREYRSGDLRDKLDRRHSPHRRYSPGKDIRGRHIFHGQKQLSRDRGRSHSRSPMRRSDGKHRKRHPLDEHSDHSESLKTSNDDDGHIRRDKISSYEEKDALEEELKQIEDDIEKIDDHRTQLERFLEDKVDETARLTRRIEDLETQLNKEHEDCKRITSKIKKFTKAYGRYLKIQEELKRAQNRIQKFGDQLGSDASKHSVTEEDSSLNIGSDGELLNSDFTTRKRPYHHPRISEETKIGSSRKRERFVGITRSEKFIRTEGAAPHPDNMSKENELAKGKVTVRNAHNCLADDRKNKHGKISPNILSLDKVKGYEVGHTLPSTSMAAQAVDDLIEAVEIDDESEAMEATAIHENGPLDTKANSSYIPPIPLVTKNAYKQYEGEDEDVEVEKVDSEMVDIDINSDIEI